MLHMHDNVNQSRGLCTKKKKTTLWPPLGSSTPNQLMLQYNGTDQSRVHFPMRFQISTKDYKRLPKDYKGITQWLHNCMWSQVPNHKVKKSYWTIVCEEVRFTVVKMALRLPWIIFFFWLMALVFSVSLIHYHLKLPISLACASNLRTTLINWLAEIQGVFHLHRDCESSIHTSELCFCWYEAVSYKNG